MLLSANSLNSNIMGKHSVFLIFGNDEGLIQYNKSKISKFFDPELKSTHFYTLLEARASLEEIVADSKSGSLFGERKVIIITEISANTSEKFFEHFKCVETAVYILQMGSLKKSSKLFKYFQSRDDMLSVQCYQLELREIADFIIKFFEKTNKRISFDAAIALASILPKNIMIVERELEKLDLFTFGKSEIAESDFLNLFAQNIEFGVDEIVFDLLFNPKKAILEIEKFISSSSSVKADSIMLTRSISNVLKRLLAVHVRLREGVSVDSAVGALRPPVFFKFRPKFLQMVGKTQVKNIRECLIFVQNLEKAAKLSPNDCAELLISGFLKQFIV